MLGKLLKYDLKWIYKAVVVFYCLECAFAVIARIFASAENSALFDILGKIAGGCTVAMIINSLINCIIRSWARFVRNVYKDESYLTHTLPVKKNTVYLSKVLAGIICSFTTIIVLVLCLLICYYSKENIDKVKAYLEIAANVYNTTIVRLICSISIVLFLEIIFILLVGYSGIIIGHMSNNNKMIKAVISGFAMYIITMLLSLGIIFVIGLFNENVMNLFKTTDAVNVDVVNTVMYTGIAIYFIYNVIYYFIGKAQLNKGVNID